MMSKLDKACIFVYAAVLTFCGGVKNDLRDMMDDERGDLVQTVLLAMVAVVLAGLLLGYLTGFLQRSVAQAESEAGTRIFG